MNRKLLIVPVTGVLALAGAQLLEGGSDAPPEPVFPTVGASTATDWADETWSANRFVGDPFDGSSVLVPTTTVEPAPTTVPEATPSVDAESPASPQPEPAPSPTTTAAPPAPTTTARDLSQAPPVASDGSGVDLPEIDDLPDGR